MKVILAVVCALHLCGGVSEKMFKNELEYQNHQRVAPPPQHASEGCPQTAFRFPHSDRANESLRVRQAIPDLTEFTVCFRFTKSNKNNDAIISYASDVHSAANDYLVAFRSHEICIWLNNGGTCVDATFASSQEYHVCIATFATPDVKRSYVFVDSFLSYILEHSKARTIPGNGVFLLGVDQNDVGFVNSHELYWVYQGKIVNFMLWSRILVRDEITKLYQDLCYCAPGYLIALTQDNVQLSGGVSAMTVNQCH